MKTPKTALTAAFAIFTAVVVADAFFTTPSCTPDKDGKCAIGVCDKCCNSFIPQDQCADCVKTTCVPAHNCTPDSTTQKCDDAAVCDYCCNKFIPANQCDACVANCSKPEPPEPPLPGPSWMPAPRFCFNADPQGTARSSSLEPCGYCGLVFNTANVANSTAPGAPTYGYGTLNYTGKAWGIYGQDFECINMKYVYDPQTGQISFPDVVKSGSVANTCLAPFTTQKCGTGTRAPDLSKKDDWIFSIRTRSFECLHKHIEDASTACPSTHMQFSDTISACSSGNTPQYDSQMVFRTLTNGATDACRSPFPLT